MAKKRRKRMDDPGNWGAGRRRTSSGDGSPRGRQAKSGRAAGPPAPPPEETFEGWVETPRAGAREDGDRRREPDVGPGWLDAVPPGFTAPGDFVGEPERDEPEGGWMEAVPPRYSVPERRRRPAADDAQTLGHAGSTMADAAHDGPPRRSAAAPVPPLRRRVGASGQMAPPPRRPATGAADAGSGGHGAGGRREPGMAGEPASTGGAPASGMGAAQERRAPRQAAGGGGKPPRRTYRRHGRFADGPEGRRFEPAGKVLVALLIGLALAALLNAQSLQQQAEAMEVGTARSVMLGLVKPVVAVSSFLHLDAPRSAIETALNRGDREQAGVHTRDVGADETAKAEIFTPTPERKLAIWVGGDSMAMVFGQSLVAMAEETGVIDTALDYHISSGLSRPDFFDWPKRLRAEMESFQPDVPVALFGANDAQDITYDGGVLYFPGEEWLAVYHERVGEAMDILSGEQQRPVWWVGMPITRLADYNENIRILNKVYREEAAKRDNVIYVDTYEMFADEDGTYTDYLPDLTGKTERVRQEDGIHWSRAGGDMVAADVLEQIAKLYKFKFPP